LPGFGHRVHSTIDPRVAVIFGSPTTAAAGDGIRFARCTRSGAARTRQTDPAQHRRRHGGGPPRPRLPAKSARCCSSSPRRRAERRGARGADARETDADQDSGHLRRRAAAPGK
jgi:hypothetical protein